MISKHSFDHKTFVSSQKMPSIINHPCHHKTITSSHDVHLFTKQSPQCTTFISSQKIISSQDNLFIMKQFLHRKTFIRSQNNHLTTFHQLQRTAKDCIQICCACLSEIQLAQAPAAEQIVSMTVHMSRELCKRLIETFNPACTSFCCRKNGPHDSARIRKE